MNEKLKANPDDTEALMKRGKYFADEEKFTNALADFDRVIELSPTADAYYYRGTVYAMMDDYKNAIADFSDAVKLDTENSLYWESLAVMHYSTDDLYGAIKAYTRALEIACYLSIRTLTPRASSIINLYYQRGWCYLEKDRLTSAIRDFKDAIWHLERCPNEDFPELFVALEEAEKQFAKTAEERASHQRKPLTFTYLMDMPRFFKQTPDNERDNPYQISLKGFNLEKDFRLEETPPTLEYGNTMDVTLQLGKIYDAMRPDKFVALDLTGCTGNKIGNSDKYYLEYNPLVQDTIVSIVFPDTLVSIGSAPFDDCTELTTITLPKSLKEISNDTFNEYLALKTLILKSPKPPKFTGDDEFVSFPKNIKIVVPSENVEDYKKAKGWKKYADRIFGAEPL